MNMQHAESTSATPPTVTAADAERELWKRLRHHQLGVVFRRRRPMGSDRSDFFCPEAALAVAVEPSDHNREEQESEDTRLRRFGLETLRFSEQDVVYNTDRVLVEIFCAVLDRTARKEAEKRARQ